MVFSVLRICFLSQPAQFGLATFTGMTLCFWAVCLSPAVASLTREPERPFAFSLMFSFGIGLAALGALAAGQLPGWFRHLPQGFAARAIHCRRGHQAHARVCLWGSAVSILPLLALSLPGAAPRVRLCDFPILFCGDSSQPWRSGPWLPARSHRLPMCTLLTTWDCLSKKMGFVFSLSQVVQFIAVLSAPLLLRRMGLVKGVILTQLATAAALASLALIHRGTLAGWVYPIYMAVQYMNEPGIFSLLMDQIP